MFNVRGLIFGFVILNLACGLLFSCVREEEYASGSGVSLSFDTDTLSFDTVFTTIGSLTKKTDGL